MHLHNNLPEKLQTPLLQDIKILQKTENARFELRIGETKDQLSNWWMHSIFILITPKDGFYSLQIESKFERWPKDISAFAEKHRIFIEESLIKTKSIVNEYFKTDVDFSIDVRTEEKFVLKLTSEIKISDEITEVKNLNLITVLLAKIALTTYALSIKIMPGDAQTVPSNVSHDDLIVKETQIDLDYVADWSLNNDQVLIVAGDWAFNIAEKYGIYECQNKRTFRPSKYMAFYKSGLIDTVFEISEKPYDNGTADNTPEMASMKIDMPNYDAETPRRIIKLKKLKSVGPVKNDGKSKSGKTVPFTYGQPRYSKFDIVTRAKVTSELVHGIQGIEIIDTIVIPKSDEAKVDILFVIDNSGSMSGFQKSLSANIDKFISIFAHAPQIPDFKIGVITTDNANPKFFDKARMIIDKNAFISEFKSSIMAGTSGSATEKGLEMATIAVKSSFSRSDAMLFVNMISDENDDSPESARYYVEQMKTVKGSKKVTVNAIYESKSAKHYEAAIITGGLCAQMNSEYGSLLTDIGSTVLALIKTLPLSETPKDTGKIQVSVNKKGATNFTYNSKLNSVDFSSPLNPGAVVDMVYMIDEKE